MALRTIAWSPKAPWVLVCEVGVSEIQGLRYQALKGRLGRNITWNFMGSCAGQNVLVLAVPATGAAPLPAAKKTLTRKKIAELLQKLMRSCPSELIRPIIMPSNLLGP